MVLGIFVDDFERVPDFQSEIEERLCSELRTRLFDGLTLMPEQDSIICL